MTVYLTKGLFYETEYTLVKLIIHFITVPTSSSSIYLIPLHDPFEVLWLTETTKILLYDDLCCPN